MAGPGGFLRSDEAAAQLAFEFPREPAAAPPLATWRYRFTADALVEDLGGRRYVYGLWHRLFGCWEVDPATGRSREFVPALPVLRPNGVWRDCMEVDRAGLGDWPADPSPRWRFEANAAFAAYFSAIPARLRGLVASLGRYQWLALDLVWQERDFARMLEDELAWRSGQYLFACFAFARAERLRRGERRALAVAMMSRRRHELLRDLSGAPCTRRTLRALEKLGDEPQEEAVYRALVDALRDPARAKRLSHVPRITPDLLRALATLPAELLPPGVLALLADEFEGDGAAAILRRLAAAAEGMPPGALGDSLSRVRDVDELDACAERWIRRFRRARKFPPPPFAGDDRLRPLTDAKAMEREARRMRNCLDDLVEAVLEGGEYYCHWAGPPPATVRLVRRAGGGWTFGGAFGRDNETLDDATAAEIESAVAAAVRRAAGSGRAARRRRSGGAADPGRRRPDGRNDGRQMALPVSGGLPGGS